MCPLLLDRKIDMLEFFSRFLYWQGVVNQIETKSHIFYCVTVKSLIWLKRYECKRALWNQAKNCMQLERDMYMTESHETRQRAKCGSWDNNLKEFYLKSHKALELTMKQDKELHVAHESRVVHPCDRLLKRTKMLAMLGFILVQGPHQISPQSKNLHFKNRCNTCKSFFIFMLSFLEDLCKTGQIYFLSRNKI